MIACILVLYNTLMGGVSSNHYRDIDFCLSFMKGGIVVIVAIQILAPIILLVVSSVVMTPQPKQ